MRRVAVSSFTPPSAMRGIGAARAIWLARKSPSGSRALMLRVGNTGLSTHASAPHAAARATASALCADAVKSPSLVEQLRAAGAKPVAESPVQALARALSPSPVAVDAAVVEACRELAPAAIVEVVTLIALLQLLHRLESYYAL